MEGRRKIPKLLIAVLLIAFFFAFQICASASDSDAIYYESFEEPFDGRWIVSQKDEYQDEICIPGWNDHCGFLERKKPSQIKSLLPPLSDNLNG